MALQNLTIIDQNITLPQVTYRDFDLVEDYLGNHPEIIDFLEAVWPTLTKFFGRSIHVELQVMTYPDGSGMDELVGWIQSTDSNIQVGLSKLEQLEEDIFDKQLEMVGDAFNFNIEFK